MHGSVSSRKLLIVLVGNFPVSPHGLLHSCLCMRIVFTWEQEAHSFRGRGGSFYLFKALLHGSCMVSLLAMSVHGDGFVVACFCYLLRFAWR